MAPCEKKGGAVGAMSPAHYLSKPGGGGGGLGGIAYKDRARLPPRGYNLVWVACMKQKDLFKKCNLGEHFGSRGKT